MNILQIYSSSTSKADSGEKRMLPRPLAGAALRQEIVQPAGYAAQGRWAEKGRVFEFSVISRKFRQKPYFRLIAWLPSTDVLSRNFSSLGPPRWKAAVLAGAGCRGVG